MILAAPARHLHAAAGSGGSADLARYALVQAVALACDCGLLLSLAANGMPYLAAAALGFIAGAVLAIALSLRLRRTRPGRTPLEIETAAVIAVGVAGLIATEVVLYLLVSRLGLPLAVAKVVPVAILVSFDLRRRRRTIGGEAPLL